MNNNFADMGKVIVNYNPQIAKSLLCTSLMFSLLGKLPCHNYYDCYCEKLKRYYIESDIFKGNIIKNHNRAPRPSEPSSSISRSFWLTLIVFFHTSYIFLTLLHNLSSNLATQNAANHKPFRATKVVKMPYHVEVC